MQLRVLTCVSLLAVATVAFGQEAPQAPTQQTPQAPAGVSPAPQEAPASFPPVNPAEFTATTPSKQTVEDFLHAYWGYDDNREWQVQAIQKTPAEGVAHVLVLVKSTAGDAKQKGQIAQLAFYTLPDGKWLLADTLLPFGAKPFQASRDVLQAGANGPSRGGSSKAMEIVEFADFECPHCKDAQPIIAKLMQDYPSAHFVYQDYPLTQVHTEAMKASLHGYCVFKAGGNEAFYKYADAVFEGQVGLTPASSDQTLRDAETKAGQDPAKIAACAATPEARQAIQASVDLGNKVGVNSTPTIFVNGRGLPVTGIPYPTLQKIIEFQAKLDGVALPPAPPAPPAKPAPSLR